MKNPTNSFRETNLVLKSSYKNHKLKLWWVGARERKKSIFCTVYFVRRNFLNICVLSQCTVYWIHFQNIHTFTYQKTLLYTLLLLVFKIVKSLQFFLNMKSKWHIRVGKFYLIKILWNKKLCGGIITNETTLHNIVLNSRKKPRSCFKK